MIIQVVAPQKNNNEVIIVLQCNKIVDKQKILIKNSVFSLSLSELIGISYKVHKKNKKTSNVTLFAKSIVINN